MIAWMWTLALRSAEVTRGTARGTNCGTRGTRRGTVGERAMPLGPGRTLARSRSAGLSRR